MYIIIIKHPAIFGQIESNSIQEIENQPCIYNTRELALKEKNRINNESNYYNGDIPSNLRPRARTLPVNCTKFHNEWELLPFHKRSMVTGSYKRKEGKR